MKKYLYVGLLGLTILEILRLYFIMPMPGSQQWDTLAFAYFLHTYIWVGRILFLGFILLGIRDAFSINQKWLPASFILLVLGICYFFNFQLTAERMFQEPEFLTFSPMESASLSDSSIVITVLCGNEAKAYPIRYIAFHHQVRDQISDKDILVTYCSVCRTGRVFEPLVDGKAETFRLVGMDHWNALFEDQATGSWWQQANGEAIIGPLKGFQLTEIESFQMTLGKFFSLYPEGKVMDCDPTFQHKYDSLGKYEFGLNKSKLTGKDSLSWKEKSWVVGIRLSGKTKAYDWNNLVSEKLIHDKIAGIPVVIALSHDQQSFKAFLRDENTQIIKILPNDLLVTSRDNLDFLGTKIRSGEKVLAPLAAYQEFWHSWRTFNPSTEAYN